MPEQRWYVSFHGGDGHHAWNNIHTFDLDGKPVGKALAVDSLPGDIELRELRGFAFGPGGDLFVANAFRKSSQILRFHGEPNADGRHQFHSVYVQHEGDNPGLAHPFSVAFGPDGRLFVPSQDTSTVGRYFGPTTETGVPGGPVPHPPALANLGLSSLPPGTFVPSGKHSPSGLLAVRGAAFGPDGHLYVADRDANAVKVYHGHSGALIRTLKHHHLTRPVHLVFASDGRLLVGNRDRHSVLDVDTQSGEATELIAPGAGGLESPGGIETGPDGNIYVASRVGHQVLRYDESGTPSTHPFIDDLHDQPEFISLVMLG